MTKRASVLSTFSLRVTAFKIQLEAGPRERERDSSLLRGKSAALPTAWQINIYSANEGALLLNYELLASALEQVRILQDFCLSSHTMGNERGKREKERLGGTNEFPSFCLYLFILPTRQQTRFLLRREYIFD
jgi:hypothetical protein